MPGSVRNADVFEIGGNPAVLPWSLSRQFVEAHEYIARVNEYRDGSSQRKALVANSRRRWKLVKRLAPAALVALRGFVSSVGAGAFYFYDPKESAFAGDPTGVSPTGRYLVVITSGWTESLGMGRGTVNLELAEVA